MTHLLKELQRILVFPVIIKGEKEQTVFAVFFCVVKCTFRILVKRFPIAGGLCGIKNGTGRNCAKGDCLAELFVNFTGCGLILSAEIKCKPVSIETVGRIARGNVFLQSFRELLQDMISVGTSVFDIDIFKVVKTENQQAAALVTV